MCGHDALPAQTVSDGCNEQFSSCANSPQNLKVNNAEMVPLDFLIPTLKSHGVHGYRTTAVRVVFSSRYVMGRTRTRRQMLVSFQGMGFGGTQGEVEINVCMLL